MHAELRRARLVLEGPIDYDAAKAIANTAISIAEDLLNALEKARSAEGQYVRYDEAALDKVLGVTRG